jgi:hypothetical protein
MNACLVQIALAEFVVQASQVSAPAGTQSCTAAAGLTRFERGQERHANISGRSAHGA